MLYRFFSPTGRNRSAQGDALGYAMMSSGIQALKVRHAFRLVAMNSME
jgi:hypothetical protein